MSEHQRVPLRGLNVGWDGERTERLLTRVEGRLGRRRVTIRAALASAALVSVAAGIALALQGHGARATASTHAAERTLSPGAVRLREGSEIRPASTASNVRVVEESDSRVLVELVQGAASYSVVPNPGRTFEVHAGLVTVKVVGTEFTLERRAESTWVEVLRGKVAVSWSGSDTEVVLGAGESGLFPRAPVHPAGSATKEREAAALPEKERESSGAYRARAARHDYSGAFALLARDPTLAGSSVQDLLLAADVARLSEHPSEAVPYLQRVIREHPGDERAPLAAFTLGRTLGGLGRTREAMSMFARVRSAWPSSALAEDALLRQAEAASKLGELVTAMRLAEQYDREYPKGRRRAEVRRYAHLE